MPASYGHGEAPANSQGWLTGSFTYSNDNRELIIGKLKLKPNGTGIWAASSPSRIARAATASEGRGDGPAAAALRTRLTDLTRLWQRYGTPLDRERLTAYIDGRGLVEVHGRREMPVWGDEFFKDAPPLTPNLVEGAKQHLIAVLIEYLETIQTERRS